MACLETLKGNGARLDVSRLRDMAVSQDMALHIFGRPVAGTRDRKEEEEKAAEMRKRRERKHAGNEPRRPILRELKTQCISRSFASPLSTSSSILLSPSFFSFRGRREFSATQHIWARPVKIGRRPTISTTKEAEGKKGEMMSKSRSLRRHRSHPAECKTHNIRGDDNIGGQSERSHASSKEEEEKATEQHHQISCKRANNMNNIVSSLPIFPPFSKRFHPTLRKK